MEPIAGIVYLNDVPPTLKADKSKLLLKFYGHPDSVYLFCTPSVILDYINDPRNKPEMPYPSFKLKIGKNRITILLKKPVYGHGTAIFKKNEFLALLKSA